MIITKIDATKEEFDIFTREPGLVYLDNAATSLKPRVVLNKMMEYYVEYPANIHRGLYPISERATEEYEKARELIAHFVGGDVDELIICGGTTDGINLIAQGWGRGNIEQGDEVLVAETEHHSNLLPWQILCREKGAKLRYCQIDRIEELVNERTKVLAMGHISNVLGVINPVAEIVRKVKARNSKVKILVDGAQAVAHMKVNVNSLGVDFYVFSGHKMYGPTGVGAIWGKKEILGAMNPIKVGGGTVKEVDWEKVEWKEGVEKFEAGTPPIAEAIGMGAAVEWLESIGWERLRKKEEEVMGYLMMKLIGVKGVKLINPDEGVEGKAGVVSFSVDGVPTHDVASILGRKFNVCVRAGYHCAQPLHQKYGFKEGTVRVSLGVYNTKEDVDVLIAGLDEVINMFK